MPRDDLVKLRGGTAAAWTAVNPVLALREPGIAVDTGELKIGDGVTPWNSLPAIGGGGGGGVVNSIVAGTAIIVDDSDPANPVVAVDDTHFGSAAFADTGDFATAAQGAAADTAVQPGDLGTLAVKDDIAVPGDIDATGTPSSSTFLRGDGTWATPAGGGSGIVEAVVAGTAIIVDDSDPANPEVSVDVTAFDPAGAAAAAQAASQPLDADLTTLATAGNSSVLAATTASYTTADASKLSGIEAGADVTDATNVAAAGAVMGAGGAGGAAASLWIGTESEYAAIGTKSPTTVYVTIAD